MHRGATAATGSVVTEVALYDDAAAAEQALKAAIALLSPAPDAQGAVVAAPGRALEGLRVQQPAARRDSQSESCEAIPATPHTGQAGVKRRNRGTDTGDSSGNTGGGMLAALGLEYLASCTTGV